MLVGLLGFIGDFIRVDSRVNLLWNYDYSSDVAHGIVLSDGIAHSNENKCNVNYSSIRIMESFKGGLQSGRIIKAVGIEAHKYRKVGSEHFLFLRPFLANEYPGFGDCSNGDFIFTIGVAQ
jgi:hypothetical protein